MKTKVSVAASIAALACIVLILWNLQQSKQSDSQAASAKFGGPISSIQKTARDDVAIMTKIFPNEPGHVSKKDALVSVLKEFFEKFQRSVAKPDAESALFRKIAKDGELVELLRKSLLDHDFAKQEFGEDQALVRVYSLKFAEHALKEGNMEDFISLTKGVTEKLDVLARNHGKFEHEINRDLESLVRSYERYLSKDRTVESDSEAIEYVVSILRDCGLNSATHSQVAEIFDDTLFIIMKGRFGRARAEKIISQALHQI